MLPDREEALAAAVAIHRTYERSGFGPAMANRAAVAERLGTAAVTFPSHHAGFLGGEYGMKGDPDAFAATLRQVLAAT